MQSHPEGCHSFQVGKWHQAASDGVCDNKHPLLSWIIQHIPLIPFIPVNPFLSQLL
jgi:hypothetical protein